MSNPLFTTLGDVHLGHQFVTGVPLHRRGDREKMVWDDFVESLENCQKPYHIQVGDLFHTFAVPEALLLNVANAYKNAAEINPEVEYILYRGNHDASRDTEKSASFDVLADLLNGIKNILVLREVTTVRFSDGNLYGFLPWHPFKSAEELAVELIEDRQGQRFAAVFGHFETESFGGHDFNLIPTKTLSTVTDTVYTGHIHTPGEFERDGVTVFVVGSMQPYSHGEDPTGEWYKTIPFDAFAIAPEGEFEDINLRVIVKPGEVPVITDNVLSLVTKPFVEVIEGDEQPDNLEVKFEEFNMHSLFISCLTNANVRPTIAEKIQSKFEELKNV